MLNSIAFAFSSAAALVSLSIQFTCRCPPPISTRTRTHEHARTHTRTHAHTANRIEVLNEGLAKVLHHLQCVVLCLLREQLLDVQVVRLQPTCVCVSERERARESEGEREREREVRAYQPGERMLDSTDALLPARRPRVHALQLRVQLECGIQELDM
jgi:hypothetical protein